MSQKIRVRFAPSPTGPLHIGGVRTALFNYLFAKKHKGDFLLRIEDTDQTRFVEGAEEYINESLEWLGLVPDEGVKQGGDYGPYRQSERKEIYLPLAKKLVESGWAYYAFDTPEELDALRNQFEAEKKTFAYDQTLRINLNNSLNLSNEETQAKISSGIPYVVRFKMPENYEIVLDDLIRGTVKFNTSTLDDKVIFKSDGLPTYHLANVVDDYMMKISHVIRGEEWLPSLPLHAMLYKAFGWENERPVFAHLPLILKPTGKGKLSKRDGDKEGFPVFPLEWKSADGEISSGYRESGYFPEAVVNLLAMLGWNPGTEEEIFSLNQLIDLFSFDRVNKSGARFNPEKAKWYNQHYLKEKSDIELAKIFVPILESKGIQAEIDYVARVVSQIKERATFVSDFWELSSYFFIAPSVYDEKAQNKFWKEDTPAIIQACLDIIKSIDEFSSSVAEEKIKAYIESNELGFGKIMNPLRLAIVGAGKGPHLFDIMEMIGKDESIKRIEKALDIL
ncbi:MAG: glutamate--tRNA ligase [Bacteroidales bacterium]|nr:glutamate--tRNA ligase [Bacteroidales bacterium]MBN2818608.1 glutamate--tRNA ligase [Bacteroidales bacterium]